MAEIEIVVLPAWPEFTVRGGADLDRIMADVGGPMPAGGAVTYSWAVGSGKPFDSMRKRIDQLKLVATRLGISVVEKVAPR